MNIPFSLIFIIKDGNIVTLKCFFFNIHNFEDGYDGTAKKKKEKADQSDDDSARSIGVGDYTWIIWAACI